MTYPPTLKSGLLSQSLNDQLLVYDRSTKLAHCLESDVAKLFLMMQESMEYSNIESTLPEDTLLVCLESLRKSGLLEEEAEPKFASGRRDFLGKVGAGFIVSLALPEPVAAGSGSGLPPILGTSCFVNGGPSGMCFGPGTTECQVCAALGLGVSGTANVILGQDQTGGNGGCSFSVDSFTGIDCTSTSSIVSVARCIRPQ